jgi:pyridoxal 5'-phosphate synthase pdxT subunit
MNRSNLSHQVRVAKDLEGLDGIVLPGGESTAMGLIGTSATSSSMNLWDALRTFSQTKPTWGTCAGMILLAERCVGTSAVITDGQALIGGLPITVCRNYFGSQIASFEMHVPPPPLLPTITSSKNGNDASLFPGIFIRAPAILTAAPDVQVLGRVVATPCRQAAVTLAELERKIAAGENVMQLQVSDALKASSPPQSTTNIAKDAASATVFSEEKKESMVTEDTIVLPGASDGSNAREVICAVSKGTLLCTAFHPELTDDHRWHQYFVHMVQDAKDSKQQSVC